MPYLENKLSAGAFTKSRIELLNILSSQAAISMENANLYQGLEQRVLNWCDNARLGDMTSVIAKRKEDCME